MRKRRAPETRNLLGALKAKMAVKGAQTEAIVHAFIKQHPDVIARENADLIYIACMKLASGTVGGRAAGSGAVQLELFAEYAVPRTVLLRQEDGQRVHRVFVSLTPKEARGYVADHTKPRSRRTSAEVKEIVRLLDDIEPHKKTDNSTISDCWAAFRKAQGA